MKLFRITEDYFGVSLNRMNRAADFDVPAGEVVQVFNRFFILADAEDEEMAILVGSLRAASVQEVDALFRVDHAIDVGGNTSSLSDVPARLL